MNKKIIIALEILLVIIAVIVLIMIWTKKPNSFMKIMISKTPDYELTEDKKNELDKYYEGTDILPIYNLPKNYTQDQIVFDNCFLSINGKLFNEDVYDSFMKKYNNHEDCFMRCAEYGIEGDLTVKDVKYLASENKVIIIIDSTRDDYGEKNYFVFERKYIGKSSTLLVAYDESEDEDYAIGIINIGKKQ